MVLAPSVFRDCYQVHFRMVLCVWILGFRKASAGTAFTDTPYHTEAAGACFNHTSTGWLCESGFTQLSYGSPIRLNLIFPLSPFLCSISVVNE